MNTKGLFKILISVVMLILAYRLVDFAALKNTLLNVPVQVALLAIVGFALTQCISAIRWWLLASAGGIQAPLLLALRAFFIGMYANCFGLGTVGGDILKGVILSQGQKKTQCVASAFADRALGLAVLSFIGVLATAFASNHHMEERFVYVLLGLALCILAAWIIGPMIIQRVVPKENSLRKKVDSLSDVFHGDKKYIACAVLAAAVFHLSQIFLLWQIALGMGISVSFSSMLVTVPFVNIISTLPISWNGLGVREKAFIFFFCPDIFTHEQAVAIGALWLVSITVASAVGGIIAFLSGGLKAFEKDAI